MNGVILVNKPSGYTSRDIVNLVSKKINTKKIGHTGTLDPLAQGVLVLCVGRATKLVQVLTADKKEYIAGITLGILTDTLDIEGNVLKCQDVNLTKEEIVNAINSMKGKYIQEVPIYSAVKVNGKKLYEYARANEDVVLPKREVEIFDIELIDDIIYENNQILFKIKCLVSKGTYIRALANDIAKKLNTIGIMNSLVRTKQGIFDIELCHTLDQINDNNFALIPVEYCLKDYYRINMDNELYRKVKNGVKLNNTYNQDIVTFYYNDKAISIYKLQNDYLKPWIML